MVFTMEEKIGVKFDSKKPKWSLFLWKEAEEIVEILTFGAEKYPTADNWKYVDDARNRYFSALMRHLTAWFNGERLDTESGKSHLAHAGCCLLFLMWKDNNEKNTM
jgi:hypothetical protein